MESPLTFAATCQRRSPVSDQHPWPPYISLPEPPPDLCPLLERVPLPQLVESLIQVVAFNGFGVSELTGESPQNVDIAPKQAQRPLAIPVDDRLYFLVDNPCRVLAVLASLSAGKTQGRTP